MVPLGYALYRHRYPLYNFQLGEMLDTFPKIDTLAADAISIFGRYTRRMLHKLGVAGVICFGFNHLVKAREGKLLNFFAAGRIKHLSLFFSDPLELLPEGEREAALSSSYWRAVILDPEAHEELVRKLPSTSWHYLPPATDPELYFPIAGVNDAEAWSTDFSYVGAYSEEVAEMMLAAGAERFLIWGEPRWGEHPVLGSRFRGSALRVGALNRIYNLSRFVLVLDEPPALAVQRGLDVLAAGSVPVMREGVARWLGELVGKGEFPLVTGGEDLLSLARDSSPAEWRSRLAGARRALLSSHTWYHRIPRLVEILLR